MNDWNCDDSWVMTQSLSRSCDRYFVRKMKIIRQIRTIFCFVIWGLLLTAVANSNVPTDVSHTHTHARTHARTHRAISNTSHVTCLSHEIRRLNRECCSTVHCSEWTHQCTIQTATKIRRFTVEQELRHPHIDC